MKPIQIEKLSKTFRGKKGRKVHALKELTLDVPSGEIVGFLGPNGAGKSTTIKTLVGQIRCDSGRASIFGAVTGTSEARSRIGYLPENPSFYDFLTAREYLDLVGASFNMGKAEISRESAKVLEIMGLEDAANRPIRGYSKGMVQRLGLAQAMLHDPDLYILDEPMSGLDPVGRALVKELILDMKLRGKTVFFSTHVIADVEAVCDRVAIIAKGKLRAENAVDDIVAEGIEGYRIRLEKEPPQDLQEFLDDGLAMQTGDLYVPRHRFNSFIQQADELGCGIQFIEPRRKSLEDFFLKSVS